MTSEEVDADMQGDEDSVGVAEEAKSRLPHSEEEQKSKVGGGGRLFEDGVDKI